MYYINHIEQGVYLYDHDNPDPTEMQSEISFSSSQGFLSLFLVCTTDLTELVNAAALEDLALEVPDPVGVVNLMTPPRHSGDDIPRIQGHRQ